MKHKIKDLLKDIPKFKEQQAKEVWEITEKLLPFDCVWRKGKDLAPEVLKLVSYCYLRKETPVLDKICFQCVQAHNKLSCPHRKNHLH